MSITDEQVYYEGETDAEQRARSETAVVLDELSQKFVNQLIDKLVEVDETMCGFPLYPYQHPLVRRIMESIIIGDGETITALQSRQSGKTESIAGAVATCMVMLPRLSGVYPKLLGKFSRGVWVGAFAPVKEQASTLFERVVERLRSEDAEIILSDPEIDEALSGRGDTLRLKRSGSLVRRTTCHPRATIEGRTYHVILVDECQYADDYVINEKVVPMGTNTRATMVFTGTPSHHKNVFYKAIQDNKRDQMERGKRINHFQVDWKEAGRSNPDYRMSAQKALLRLGEDSDEFKRQYRCLWLLESGMFTTSEKLDALGDTSMQQVVHTYSATPCVAGIDCGRKQDRTVVTVVYVDWDNPDPFGLYHHRVLNWLDLENTDWEEQYFRIREFLSNYNVWKVGIDSGGLGDVVAQRLRLLMPYTEIIDITSTQAEQSRRWKHLMQLMERGQIAWPAGAKVRRLRAFRRFYQEMADLQLEYKGPYLLCAAPKERNAHDDYPDSLALACVLSLDEEESAVEVYDNIFYR